MVDAEGLYEYVAAPGILGSEVGDLLESRFYGPQSLLWIEDAELPKVEEVSGHLLKELFHGRGSFGGARRPGQTPCRFSHQMSSVEAMRTCSAETIWFFSCAAAMRAPRAR
ncbi:hypothetical protein DAMNIGENAA_15560 [Desulforhabdus amnigena]|uniref:Uncharacterized protein n=1 Tax=Desulforhabdus amnigena TaxID=40218 RepID=A0A9W6CYJ7_9BACT|nr:hypothetical protein DAMNIGENAA_00050 [Desulforhabdus amnigena]GLI34123.1 hypothetical protein DAMNIGENAA_15560 [Desulforhabdus amnigena]